jgi:hypothetical protein
MRVFIVKMFREGGVDQGNVEQRGEVLHRERQALVAGGLVPQLHLGVGQLGARPR